MSGASQVAALVDGRVIDHPTAGGRGVGRYTIGFVRAMLSAGISTQVLCVTDEQHRRWRDAIPEVTTTPFLRQVFEDASDDPWFICTQLMLHPVPLDVIPRVVTELDLKVAAIVHDVIPQRFPERYLTNDHARLQTRLRTLTCRSIERFCANSTFTADTSAVELGVDRSRITVVGAVIEPQFISSEPGVAGTGSPTASLRRSVLAVTGADQRKNTERLIAAWSRLPAHTRANAELVVACAAPQSTLDHWNHLAVFQGVGNDIRFTGEVTDDELVALMQWATLGVMPSLEEGFGLPIAEMVACGTPVLCSSTSSMPEVAGCDDALFDPYDVEDMARLLDRTLNDEQFRLQVLAEETVRLQRWSVEQVGKEVLSALRRPTRVRRARTSRPMSIAFVAPHPGSRSAIGAYTHMILDAWQAGDEIISLDDCSVSAERLTSRKTVRPAVGAGAVGRTFRSHDVDHLVIALGSSEHHAVSLERAATGGAHLWLHEATALGAVIGPAHVGGGERWARERLADIELSRVSDVDLANPAELHAQGITCLGSAIREARSIITTSQQAVESLTGAFGPSLPPTTVIPLAHPDRRQSSVGGNRVISFGVVDDNKRPDHLVEMLVRCEDIDLEFVGAITDHRRDELLRLAEQCNVGHRLKIHGRVENDDLDTMFEHVRCAVQLREGHPGQMSAAICELLARGIPVVTNMTTHGNSHDGLLVVEGDVGSIAAAVHSLKSDEQAHHAGETARAHARQWMSTHVANALRDWLCSQSVSVMARHS